MNVTVSVAPAATVTSLVARVSPFAASVRVVVPSASPSFRTVAVTVAASPAVTVVASSDASVTPMSAWTAPTANTERPGESAV